jgi:hypothetical protein
MAQDDERVFYDYDGLAAYQPKPGDWNVKVVMPGGEERPVYELGKFMLEASEVPRTEFDRLRNAAMGAATS